MGPLEHKTLLLPYKLSGRPLTGIVVVLQLSGILASYSITRDSRLRLHLFNSNKNPRVLSPKVHVLGILKQTEERFSVRYSDSLSLLITSPKSVEAWEEKYPRVFSTPAFGLTETNLDLMVHETELEFIVPLDQIPLNNRGESYPHIDVSEQEVNNTLTDMVQRGIISAVDVSERGFCSPILFLKKKAGGVRATLDLRVLNKYVKSYRDVQPGVHELLSRIPVNWTMFSLVDVVSGFFHLPLSPRLHRLFHFEALGRRFKFLVLPMGFGSSMGIFSDRLRSVLRHTPALVYADDIIVGSEETSSHDRALDLVFSAFDKYNIHVNPSKIKIGVGKLRFLGFDIENGQYHMTSYIEEQCQNLPTATSLTQIRKFLGIFNVLRGVCPMITDLVYPLQHQLSLPPEARVDLPQLQQLTAKIWRAILEKHQHVFLFPQGPKEFHVTVDWSTHGQGYCLWVGTPSQGYLVGMGSSNLKEPVSSMLGEMRTLCWALKKTLHLTAGHSVVVWTDSEATYYRLTRHRSKTSLKDVRIYRLLSWLLVNFEGRLQIRYLPSSENVIADSLSRWEEKSMGIISVLSEQQRIWLTEAHKGHWGVDKTWLHLRRDGHHWIHDRRDVEAWVANCPQCQYDQPREFRNPWKGFPSKSINEVLYLDYLGPISWHGRRQFVLVIVDGASRLTQLAITRRP